MWGKIVSLISGKQLKQNGWGKILFLYVEILRFDKIESHIKRLTISISLNAITLTLR